MQRPSVWQSVVYQLAHSSPQWRLISRQFDFMPTLGRGLDMFRY